MTDGGRPSRRIHGTTILAVRRDSMVAVGGDGQVSLGDQILKMSAVKVRRMHEDRVLAGFAGGAADALTLFEKLEGYLEEFPNELRRCAYELAKEWRSDRALRRLEAEIIVADLGTLILVSGTGDLLIPDDDVIAIGSGSGMAIAAARALHKHTQLGADEVVREALHITADICLYTNHDVNVETLVDESKPDAADG